MRLTGRDSIHILFLMLMASVFLPKPFYSHTAFYTRFLTVTPLACIASLTKLLFLGMGFVCAIGCSTRFERGNPVRPAWQLLAAGLLSYFFGQFVLGIYQLVLFSDTPFPSVADVFFLLAMVLWFLSLTKFVGAYTEVGFLEGGNKRTAAVVFLGAVLMGGLGYGLLIPILSAPALPAEKALNLAYPLSDLMVMIPALLLLRMAYKLRGGEVWRVWLLLLVGFLFLGAGDILFAYFSTLGKEFLDPVLDFLFAASYIFISWGTTFQYELLRH